MSAVQEKIAASLKPERLNEFLSCLERTGVVTISANAIGMKPTVLYVRRKLDPEFAERWHQAKAIADKEVADEVRRRAIGGIKEDVYHQGEVVGQKVIHSNSLLTLLAKSASQEYRDQSKVVVSTLDDEKSERDELDDVSEEQLRAFVKMAERLSGTNDQD